MGGRYQDFMPEKSKVSYRGCPPDTVSSLLQTHTLLPIPVWGTSQVFHFYSSCYATSAYQTQWLKCTELQMAFLLQKTSELLCCIRLRYKDPEGSAFDKVNLRVNAAPTAKTIYYIFFLLELSSHAVPIYGSVSCYVWNLSSLHFWRDGWAHNTG